MQNDRTSLMAFMSALRLPSERSMEMAVEPTPTVPNAQQTVLAAGPMQSDRTSLRAIMDRIAESRTR